jgi:ubiquinone biosynthesis monooxygenase Coq7
MLNQKIRFPNLLKLPSTDDILLEIDKALKTLTTSPIAERPNPALLINEHEDLSDIDKQRVVGMMRVNHVGEICAQALYQGQSLSSPSDERRSLFNHAAKEETDHLAWTEDRLNQLGARTSILNPFWYSGAFALGLLAGRLGDQISLGFMAETEKQVETHLNNHLSNLPTNDHKSRAILEQMRQDEINHGQTAIENGASQLPLPVKLTMKIMSKIMTTLAQKI